MSASADDDALVVDMLLGMMEDRMDERAVGKWEPQDVRCCQIARVRGKALLRLATNMHDDKE